MGALQSTVVVDNETDKAPHHAWGAIRESIVTVRAERVWRFREGERNHHNAPWVGAYRTRSEAVAALAAE